MKDFFASSRIAVTGGAGTVGQEILGQLLEFPVEQIVAIDNREHEIFHLSERFRNDARVNAVLADTRDSQEMIRLFGGIDYVFHVAALKQVPVCEKSPTSAISTNVLGTQNVIQAAKQNGVKKFLFTSSDKAVNPTNVMGTSKLMAEKLVTAAAADFPGAHHPVFATTRFGNIAGSAGSVIPLFCEQISKGNPITLTHREMTRFVMTLEESVQLVTHSMAYSQGGEVFVTKMPVIRIGDLVDSMCELIAPLYGRSPDEIQIQEIGPRPGEKFFEELMNSEEIRRAWETNRYMIITPAIKNLYSKIEYQYPEFELNPVEKIYISDRYDPISNNEIKEMLLKPGVLPLEVSQLLESSR